ncbi:hypothetical protein DSL72_004293 [Monilinia vaccinii-corymbosi]|uniref:Mannosyltransferase n=1 Tax=Monilinia vaccinii-corymbosi TaxID=61207 RepID=A0A8A3P3H1_9HELO|nr:hypothetical protein DSL72_004293 [Monilinia vaccinii-corymbosi]
MDTSLPTDLKIPSPQPSTHNLNTLSKGPNPGPDPDSDPDIQENGRHRLVNEQTAKDVWVLLAVFRTFNSFLVKTFFQPDEYFQSLEPAWQMAFGTDSGAWLTWEWHYQLRSSLHPALFAVAYYLVDKPMAFLNFFPQFRAEVLAVLPNVIQAILAANCDYYTWRMAEKIYGLSNGTASVAILMSILSPWNWFCSTRTFSNSLETSLTIHALYYWPWDMAIDTGKKIKGQPKEGSSTSVSEGVFTTAESVKHLRYSLLLAGTACILRPTNLLIWFCVIMPTIISLIPGVSPKSSTSPTSRDYIILIIEALLCGSLILVISALSDRLYFGEWTFPPYQWLHFNISQNLAVFYGKNDWHYFLSQGLPLLLLTYLPFTILSLFKTFTPPDEMPNPTFASNIQTILTHVTGVMIFILSTISHKEVRFIYPLLPILLILTAPSVASFFSKEILIPANSTNPTPKIITKVIRKPLLTLLILLNIALAAYTTLIHQSAVISVTTFIRHRYETEMLDAQGIPLHSPEAYSYLKHYPASLDEDAPRSLNIDYDIKKEENSQYAARRMGTSANPHWQSEIAQPFVGFLMPCHSTGWRSRLVHKGLGAWALSCEPPIHLPPEEREGYRDEADRFYDDPLGFLRGEIVVFPEIDGVAGGDGDGGSGRVRKRWPRYLVGFEGIEADLREFYDGVAEGTGAGRGKKMKEVWRERNTQWIDDWRRSGDVVVWEFV